VGQVTERSGLTGIIVVCAATLRRDALIEREGAGRIHCVDHHRRFGGFLTCDNFFSIPGVSGGTVRV
jgi:hypothetical protein